MTIRRVLLPLLLACLAGPVACADAGEAGDTGDDPAAEAAAPAADSVTRRQRDSVIGESRLPGAAGVRGALDASDAAAARNAAIDSVRP